MLRFNHLLETAGLEPGSVRLLRHRPILSNGQRLIDTWHTNRAAVRDWQAVQDRSRRAHLAGTHWASFMGTPEGKTVLEGVYALRGMEPVEIDLERPLTQEVCIAGSIDQYRIETVPAFSEYAGRMLIDWGGGASGPRAWIQRADLQDKPIVGLLEHPFEVEFPGYLSFEDRIDTLGGLSPTWVSHLRRARGVYLLSCPVTGKHYTGSATGADGFWGRWCDYRATGDGGNLALKNVDTSAFRVSILQVAGSAETPDDIVRFEAGWKRKLGSRLFGFDLN